MPSRVPLKPLRNFLHHIGKFCFAHRAGDKRFYQKLVWHYCQTKLPNWHDSEQHDGAMLRCHERYWRTLQRHDGSPCRFAEYCHLLISNREEEQPWRRWCINITACLLDPAHELLAPEERYGVFLGDKTAFGPGHERIFFDSIEKYMGGSEIATFIFEKGVPQLFDYNNVFEATSETRTKLLIEALDWWCEFLHNVVMYEYNERVLPRDEHTTFGKCEKLRSRPTVFRSAPYKIITTTDASWNESWRSGQSGEWLYIAG